jgi:Tol biopolymer transport system component
MALTVSLLCLFVEAARAEVPAGKLAYIRDGNLYTIETAASGKPIPGKRPQKLTALHRKGIPTALAWSSDGRLIALSMESRPGGTSSLYIVAAKARATLRYLAEGDAPAFAPQGHLLAYTEAMNGGDRWTDRVCLTDLDTHKTRVLREKAHTPCWSADGRRIALIDESKNEFTAIVAVVDAATGRHVAFRQEAINAESPLLSPNGRYLAYNPHMSRPPLEAAIADLKIGDTVGVSKPGEPVLDWSPDSQWLLWTRCIIDPQNDGSCLWSEVWATTPHGTHSHKMDTGSYARFTPDGRHVLYLRQRPRPNAQPIGLYVADLRGRHRQLVLKDVHEVFAVWLPTTRSSVNTPRRETKR